MQYFQFLLLLLYMRLSDKGCSEEVLSILIVITKILTSNIKKPEEAVTFNSYCYYLEIRIINDKIVAVEIFQFLLLLLQKNTITKMGQ